MAGLIVLSERHDHEPECHTLDLTLKHSSRAIRNIFTRYSYFDVTSCWNCRCGSGWKHLIWWTFEFLKVDCLESSDCGEIENRESWTLIPFYYPFRFGDLFPSVSRNDHLFFISYMYVTILLSLKKHDLENLNGLNSLHSYFFPIKILDTQWTLH